jgi:hypothetical protein
MRDREVPHSGKTNVEGNAPFSSICTEGAGDFQRWRFRRLIFLAGKMNGLSDNR